MSDPLENGERPPVLMPDQAPPRPWQPPAAPPGDVDLPSAKAALQATLQSGSLAQGIAAGTAALAASNRAMTQLAQGRRADEVLQDWGGSSLPLVATGARRAGLAAELDRAWLPLLDGARGALTRAAEAQRHADEIAAGVASVEEASKLAARAPEPLARATAERIAEVLGPELGRLFLQKATAWQLRGELEQDAGRDLAADPRAATLDPEILADLQRDQVRLAREQGMSRATEEAVRRTGFGRELREDATAVTRGVAPPPRTREQFLDYYGPQEGELRWQLWLANQAKAPLYAQVRGKTPAEIAAAGAAIAGDRRRFDAIVAEDAAERRRDPAGYGLQWAPGFRAAYEAAETPEEKRALLWEAQAAAGIPEAERSPLTAEEAWTFADQWIAAGQGGAPHQIAKARVELVRETLKGLSPELRAAGVAQLARLELDAQAPGRIEGIAQAIEETHFGKAYAAAQPNTKPPQPAELEESPRSASGLPASLDHSWADWGYSPERRSELQEVHELILAVERWHHLLPEVHDRIAFVFGDDAVAVARYQQLADELARAAGDDPITGDDHRTHARDAVLESLERVKANEPYEEAWATAGPLLAQLEADSGLKLRPADGPGLVAIYEDGRSEPALVLPLNVVELLEDDGDALARFIALAGKLVRGEDISSDLAAYEKLLVSQREYMGFLPVANFDLQGHSSLEDRSAFEEFTVAIEGARDRLAEGQNPLTVLLHLAQVALADELDDTDLATSVLLTGIEFLPYYDFVDLGINTVDLLRALEAGDGEAALAAGLGAALAAIGVFPIVGDLAKSGLSWVARKTGLLPSPKSRAVKWLTTKANALGELLDHLEQKLRYAFEGDTRRFHRYNGRAPDPTGLEYSSIPTGEKLSKLPKDQQIKYNSLIGFMRHHRGYIGEREIARITDSLQIFRGTERTTKTVWVRVHDGKRSKVKAMDIVRFPSGSQILHNVNSGIRGTKQNPLTPQELVESGGFIIESKVGASDLDSWQKRLRNQINEEATKQGREAAWFSTSMPSGDLGLKEHLAWIRVGGIEKGLSSDQIEKIVKDVRSTFPRTWPAVAMIVSTELALLTFSLNLPQERSADKEQAVPVVP